jgi:predicted ATPase
VPLFVEELTKTVLESGLLVEETGRYRLDGPLLPLAVPATLQDSLMARLDRLAPVKEIAAIGALIGREFSYALLQRVADRDRETLDSALTQLEAAELLFRTGSPPDFRYRFKHALVQDAAYESLLRSRRQILHRRIAEVLQDAFAAQVSTEPEVVAHHYGQAGLTELAVDWWTKAGDRAANRSAVIEAVAHYSRAIALSDSAPTAPVRRQTRLRLQINYGQTLAAAHGPGALETIAAFARARDLAEAVEDPTERRSLRAGLWTNSFVHGDIAAARQIAADFQIEAATRQGSPEYCIAHRVLGATACLEGELTLARMHLERAVTAYDPTRDTAVQSPYGHDLGVITMGHLAAVLWQLGEIDAGRACVADTLRIAIGSQHLATMIYGYFYKSLFEAQAMRADRVTPSARAMFDLCNEHFQQSGWLAGANFMLGWADCEAGEHARGLATMRRAIGFFREQEVTTYPIFYRGILGYTEARAGQVESGLATVEEALADSERIGLRWFLSELGRLRGEILLMLPRPRTDAAEAAFTRALDIARAQAARSYELRAALGLAKLYEITGRERLIRDLLSQVSSTFRPDPDFVELEQARRLLARLD